MNELLKLVILSVTAILYLFIVSKFLGKKQIAQLEFIDYIIGISIGSIAASMAVDNKGTPWYHYIVAITVFAFIDIIISFLGRKGPWLKRFFKGKPTTIIYEGQILYANLKKAKLDINDLLALSRNQGYFNLEDIEFAVFENNGMLSVMPKGNLKPTVIEDIAKQYPPASLPNHLVVDGKISHSGLRHINKDVDWLLKELKLSNKKELKTILLASYNKDTNEFNTHHKNKRNGDKK